MSPSRGSHRALVVLLSAVALLVAACSPAPGRASRPPAPDGSATYGGCRGLHRDDVSGPLPSYVDGALARFANDTAMCRALWLPTADRWLVPQGLALDGETAWVSGYRWHRELGRRPCRLLHVSLRTGRLLASTDRIAAEVYGPYETFCRHGGALSLDRHGLWVVESDRLWLVDPHRVGHPDQVRRVWRLETPVRGSVLVDGSRTQLGIGTWRDDRRGRMSWFRYRDLLEPGVSALGSARGAHRAGQVRTSTTVRRVQGTARGRGAGVARGVWSTASTTTCGMLVDPGGRRIAFAPGAEDVEFDGRGRVWAVLESGARPYQRVGRPLVPMLAQFDVGQLVRGQRSRCSW